MNNQNIVNQLVNLAADKYEFHRLLERNGVIELANDYWHQFNGMIECIMEVAGCRWTEAFDMVVEETIKHELG